ncbi:unnamed protein product [Microthlaspi erraticum]|uniref:Uncharacterized protein n=1 Tax=Microthlaspi erraticum TaxID=1685480 RepID=A0A6D2K8Y0_9BRAS|nr:unnamed protein product [Microthlaspi erraticum]
MAPPADDHQKQADCKVNSAQMETPSFDATNGHVNPPPPPVPDVEAPVTTAALTAAMQGFAAQIASQFAEMQAQQQKYNDKTKSGQTAPQPQRSSKVHGATSSTPDNTEILAEKQKIGDSKTVTSVSSMAETSPSSRRCLQNRHHLKNFIHLQRYTSTFWPNVSTKAIPGLIKARSRENRSRQSAEPEKAIPGLVKARSRENRSRPSAKPERNKTKVNRLIIHEE